MGSTNSSGRLLVPDMRAFDLNHIAIEATDIPPDVTIKRRYARDTAPGSLWRSGQVPDQIQPWRIAATGR